MKYTNLEDFVRNTRKRLLLLRLLRWD